MILYQSLLLSTIVLNDTYVSLSTIVLNSRDRQGMYGMQHFCASTNKPYNKL